MRVLYVEMAFGFGGSLTGLLSLFRYLPPEIEPVLLTGFDATQFVTLPDRVTYEQFPYRKPERKPANAFVKLSREYLDYIRPWRKRILEAIDKYKPVLIHSNNGSWINFPAALAAHARRIPIIGYQKGFEWEGRPNRFVVRRPYYAHYVPDSQSVADVLLGLGLNPSRQTVLYEPTEPPTNWTPIPPHDPPVVGMFSLLQPWKGQEILLRAVALVARRRAEPFRVLVAGSSPDGSSAYPDKLRQLASELGIADRVTFPGHLRDMHSALRQVDIAVHASTSPEPFGRVISEAMVNGLAVIATKGGGAGEVVTHEKTGLHVPMGDVEAMANAIERLLADPSLRQRLGQAGREWVLRECDPADHARKVVDLYHRVLKGKRSP